MHAIAILYSLFMQLQYCIQLVKFKLDIIRSN